MNRHTLTRIGLLAASTVWLLGAYAYSSGQKPQPDATPDQATFFENKVRPVLAQNCLGCHGKDTQNGGLRLDSLDAMLKGGGSGPAIVPGDPDKSLLIQAVRQTGGLKMPMGAPKLSADTISTLEQWVKMGAPWPGANGTAKTPKPLWSLKPVERPAIPSVKMKDWVQNPIDNFVLAKMEADGLHPAPRADRRTLLRRVTYDLTGLPPTEEETSAFLADKSPNAYEKVVDRLMASPHYGERMARHWMDVARYADTKGYDFTQDRVYANAYTYRDWLIKSFNADLPYDQFIIDQLAADQLPEVKSGEDASPLAAMGFLTLGRRFLEVQPDIIDDRIDVTMRGFEGFTVECARCHDHKFDPIPTQDYYSLYGVFASSEEKTLPIGNKAVNEPYQKWLDLKGGVMAQIQSLELEQVQKLRSQKPETLSEPVKFQLQSLRIGTAPEGDALKVLREVFEPDAKTKLATLEGEVVQLDKDAPPAPDLALAMVDKPNPSDGVIFHHGNPANPGGAAPRRFLLALSKPGAERIHWTKDSGRMELAEDIADKGNPLTARVFVNRVWQDHFGFGIVRTPSDFGHQGEPPTDPKLLDYLASTFMDSGWSIKKLNRLIVTSATYCQSSEVSADKYNKDPDNRDWDRMNRRRLDLEQVRDSMMMAAGNLDLSKVGGKSVDLWSEPFTPRRAVYGYIDRQNLPATFRTFDLASPDATSAKRFTTTVPQQALFFMNSPFTIENAIALASRPEIQKAKDNAQRVRRLYQDLFQRLPDESELQVGLQYLASQSAVHEEHPKPVWEYGFGGWDGARELDFTPMAHYDNGFYHPTAKFPDPTLGYLTINNIGGHPGRDPAHAVVRRWISPFTGRVSISGTLVHGDAHGDGVRGRIVPGSGGLLGEWIVHNGKADTSVAEVNVTTGETIDFIVDCRENDGYDSFAWAPAVHRLDQDGDWNATGDFEAPPQPPLTAIELYAQALMMTNEFMFID
jgi:mono/diheme cytochrome c family protein